MRLKKRGVQKFFSSLKYIAIILVFLGVIYPQSVKSATGVPKILNYQGRLLNSSGDLLGTSSGTDYCFRFSIYSSATVGQGSKLWPSGTPQTMTINVKSGIFNAGIGDTSANGDTLNFNFYDNDTIYLNVEVAAQSGSSCSGVSSFDTLSPRQRIVASAFAINASSVFGTGVSAMGTTTPASNTVLTVEATSTISTPILIRGYVGQTADLLKIVDSSSNHLLSINSSGGIFASSTVLVGTSSATAFIIDSSGRVGVGTSTTATNKFNISEATSNPQFRISQTGSLYSEFYIDSAGDMRISTTGKNVRLDDQNLYVCSGVGCGVSDPNDKGNAIVETAVILGNKFQLRQIDASSTIMCDSVIADCNSANAILEFDEVTE